MFKKYLYKRKWLVISFLIIISILISIQIIARNYINSNSENLVGRKLNINSLYINYLTGALYIHDLVIYEENKTDTFVFVDKLYVNPSIISILFQEYTIHNIEIEGLICNTILTEEKFNFDSIIDYFSNDTDTIQVLEEETASVHWGLTKFSLEHSSISFLDHNINSEVILKNINLNIPDGILWNKNDVGIHTKLEFESGGSVNSKFNINIGSGDYNLDLYSQKLEISILLPYIKDFLLTNEFGGKFFSDLIINGNYNNSTNIDITGILGCDNLFLNDTSNTKVIGLNRFYCDIDSLNPEKDIYKINKFKLEVPYCYYEITKETDNFSRLMIESDTTIVSDTIEEYSSNIFVMLRDYVAEAMEGVKASNFSIDTVYINDITLHYVDSSMLQPFEYSIAEMDIYTNNVDSNSDSLLVNCHSSLNNTGNLIASALFDPQKPGDVIANMEISNFEMKDLSPMFHYYTGLPVLKGKFRLKTNLLVKDQFLNCENELLLESFTLGKKQKHDEAMNLPVKAAVSMLKDKEGNISLDIPVEGDLSDPKYKIGKIIGGIFKDLIIKAAAAPGKAFSVGGTEDDKSNKITLDNAFNMIGEEHYQTIDKIAKILIEKPELRMLINPYYNINNERELIALSIIKAEYYSSNKDTTVSIMNIDYNELYSNDSLFIQYVNSKSLPEDLSLSLNEKALKLVNDDLVIENISIRIVNNIKLMNSYLLSKGVRVEQLEEIDFHKRFLNKDTKINNVQYHILFEKMTPENESL